MIKDPEFLELFRKNKKDVAVAKQLTGLEDLWNSKAKSQLRQGRELAEQASAGQSSNGVPGAARRRAQVRRAFPATRKSSHVRCDDRTRRPRGPPRGARMAWGPWALAGLVLAFLGVFLLCPLAGDLHRLRQRNRRAHAGPLQQLLWPDAAARVFSQQPDVALASVFFASVIAIPLAYLTVRFEFRGALLIQTLGVLPLIMPPFVGAVALQLIFGRSGSVNLLLNDWFGFTHSHHGRLVGVTFVESIHYFPFILLNLVAAMRNIDGAMEESAHEPGRQGLAAVLAHHLPAVLPGYLAGAALVFVKVFDDLGTPLVMGVTNMLAPQAYLRITSVGIEDPLGYVISVIMIAFSILALWMAARVMKGKDYSTLQKGGGSLQRRRLRGWESVLAYGWIVFVLLVTLAPHIGILLMSFQGLELFGAARQLHAGALRHRVQRCQGMIYNTLKYCLLAAGLDVVLGTAIAYLIYRTDAAGAPVAGLPGLHRAGDSGPGAGHRLPAHVQGRERAVHRHADGRHLGPDHDRLCGAPPAVCAALVHGGAAAGACLAGRGGQQPGRGQAQHGAPRHGAADAGRHPGRLCHQLHHGGGGAVGHHPAHLF
jgi:ABC-type Fe3+ transport system permease subunit